MVELNHAKYKRDCLVLLCQHTHKHTHSERDHHGRELEQNNARQRAVIHSYQGVSISCFVLFRSNTFTICVCVSVQNSPSPNEYCRCSCLPLECEMVSQARHKHKKLLLVCTK